MAILHVLKTKDGMGMDVLEYLALQIHTTMEHNVYVLIPGTNAYLGNTMMELDAFINQDLVLKKHLGMELIAFLIQNVLLAFMVLVITVWLYLKGVYHQQNG